MRATRRTTTARVAACAGAVLLLAVVAAPAVAGDRAVAPVDLGGTPVEEPATDPGAPLALTAGLWADELGDASSAQAVHQFSYTRTMADSTVHVGVVGASTDPSSDALELTAAVPGVDCGTADARPSSPVVQAVFGASLSIGPDEPGARDSECLTSDEITFAVGRGSSSSETDLPIAIKIVEEAPTESRVDDLPDPPEEPTLEPAPEAGASEELDGSTSFADAPRLEPGTAYSSTVTEGEQRLYRVRLEWGQSLSARLEVPARDSADYEEAGSSARGLHLSLVNPVRDVFVDVLEGDEPTGTWSDEPATLLQGSPTVTYLSRFDGDPASLPGDYWVAVAVQPADEDADPVGVPVELTVAVEGEESGVPAHPDVVLAPGGSAGPDGYDPQTPYLVAEDVFSDDPSADGGAGDGLSVARVIGGGSLAVVGLISLGAGLVLLRRRRRWVAQPG